MKTRSGYKRLAGRSNWLIWFIWFIWFVSFNQKPNKQDKPNNVLLALAEFFSVLLETREG
jgi:hypothetical protein